MEKASKEIIRKLKDGDHNAFEHVYNIYVDKLYYFILKLLKSPEMAEELVQEIFIRIWLLRDTLNTELSFDAFLFKIARNLSINLIKKTAYQHRVKDEIRVRSTSYSNSTESTVEYNETSKHLEEVLKKLPPKRQQIYRMSRMEGLDHNTIANNLNISKNTVKVQMVKASKFVKDHMKQYLKLGLFLIFLIF